MRDSVGTLDMFRVCSIEETVSAAKTGSPSSHHSIGSGYGIDCRTVFYWSGSLSCDVGVTFKVARLNTGAISMTQQSYRCAACAAS